MYLPGGSAAHGREKIFFYLLCQDVLHQQPHSRCVPSLFLPKLYRRGGRYLVLDCATTDEQDTSGMGTKENIQKDRGMKELGGDGEKRRG
jgi:hypothetical protein